MHARIVLTRHHQHCYKSWMLKLLNLKPKRCHLEIFLKRKLFALEKQLQMKRADKIRAERAEMLAAASAKEHMI